MRKFSLLLSTIVGSLLCVDAVALCITTGFNMGNMLVLCLGLALLLIGIYYNKLGKRLQKWIAIVMGIAVPVTLLMVGFIVVKGRGNTSTFTEDCVVVLGAGIKGEAILKPLQARLDKCLEYAAKNPAALIIVSGGKGRGEDISEALAMERYLIANGVSADRIIKEDQSKDTYENMVNSKAILDARFANGYTAVYITNNFHSYRAGKIAEGIGLELTSYSTELPVYLWPPCYLREVLSMWKFWLYR